MQIPTNLLTRLAPTPSGYLHIGNAFSFVLTWVLARKNNGCIFLRIDDLDRNRFRTEYLEDIFYSLEWLGVEYDLGPSGPTDFLKNYSQYSRMELYKNAKKKLLEKGNLFPCNCSRKQIAERSVQGQYDGYCLHSFDDKSLAPIAWRSNISNSSLMPQMHYSVVWRKEDFPSYHLASVIDDDYWKINFIVRGEDLQASTQFQLLLSEQLDTNLNSVNFLHHYLLNDDSGRKLSKSFGSQSLASLRKQQIKPIEIYKKVARYLSLPEEEISNINSLLINY
ncbi:MAG: glutamate--tRNA ligase family protein [Bacteriovoracia bacterium]